MDVMVSIIGSLFAITAEVLLMYLWFIWHFLKKKNMSIGQFMSRTRDLRELSRRVEKNQVFPSYKLYCFLKDNRAEYISIFTNIGIMAGCAFFFIFISAFATFVQGDPLIQIVLCMGMFWMMQKILFGREAQRTSSLDRFILILIELEIQYGKEVDNLLAESTDKNRTRKNKECFKNSEKYLDKKYEDIRKHIIAPEDEKWYDKKPFWIFLGLVVLAVVLLEFVHSVVPLIEYMNGTRNSLLGEESLMSKMDIIAGVFALIIFLIMWAILNRKKTKKFDFITRVWGRIQTALFGPQDIRIRVSKDLQPWYDKTKKMCAQLHIRGIRVEKCFDAQNLAVTDVDENGVAVIYLDSYQMESLKNFCLRYKGKAYSDIITFIIGHELAHIHFGDVRGGRAIWKWILTVFAAVVYPAVIYRLLLPTGLFHSGAVMWLYLIILLGIIFIGGPMTNKRYLENLRELRADRIGLNVAALEPDVFGRFMEYCSVYGMEEADQTHPDIGLRYAELQKHRTWGVFDYIRYAVRFRKNRFLRRKSIL